MYSPLYVFKREQTQRRFCNHNHLLNDEERKEEFDNKAIELKKIILGN